MNQNSTWNDLVREYFPSVSDQDCEFILWEKTSFPTGSVDAIRNQIQTFKEEAKHKIEERDI